MFMCVCVQECCAQKRKNEILRPRSASALQRITMLVSQRVPEAEKVAQLHT